jgi:tetratricopeptide (TPR) repeat protein
VEKAPRANYVYEASARVQRGDHLVGRGAYAAAERSFRRASELLPTVLLRAQFEGPLGSCLAATGQFEDAEWRLTRAFDVAVEWYGPWRNETMRHVDDLVLLYRMWGRLDAAKAWHRRSIEERRRPADHLFLAETLWQFGRLAQARATIEQAPAAGAKGLLHLANLTLLEGQLDQAIRNAEQASKLADGLAAKRRWMPSREIQVGAQRVWAQALLARGDARAALPHFELGAADPRPDGGGFFSDYGKALVAVGPGAAAGRARMAQLTREREEDPLAWHARARFLATTEGLTGQDRKQAVQCAQRASELCRGRRAFVLATLAEAQFQAGDAEAALETAAAVETLMAGRDAQWLSVEQAAARFQAYR